jgi:hypothetical protein
MLESLKHDTNLTFAASLLLFEMCLWADVGRIV